MSELSLQLCALLVERMCDHYEWNETFCKRMGLMSTKNALDGVWLWKCLILQLSKSS